MFLLQGSIYGLIFLIVGAVFTGQKTNGGGGHVAIAWVASRIQSWVAWFGYSTAYWYYCWRKEAGDIRAGRVCGRTCEGGGGGGGT